MIWSFCGTKGAISLRCILSDRGNEVVKTRVLPQPTDQGQCSDYKISTQMLSWPEMPVLISSWEYLCCQKERQTCQKKSGLQQFRTASHYTSSITRRWMGTLAKVFHHEPVLWESHKGKKQEFLNSFITQYNYVFQPKLMLALLSRIPSFHKGKMRSRTNRLSMLAFPCVSKRDISVWKWALKPAWLIQFWFTIVLKMVAETKTNLRPQTTSISPSPLKAPFFLVQLPQWHFYHPADSKFYFPFTILVILKNTCTQWLICIHSGNIEINSLWEVVLSVQ